MPLPQSTTCAPRQSKKTSVRAHWPKEHLKSNAPSILTSRSRPTTGTDRGRRPCVPRQRPNVASRGEGKEHNRGRSKFSKENPVWLNDDSSNPASSKAPDARPMPHAPCPMPHAPCPGVDYELLSSSNMCTRSWSRKYRSCWHQTCPPGDTDCGVWMAFLAEQQPRNDQGTTAYQTGDFHDSPKRF